MLKINLLKLDMIPESHYESIKYKGKGRKPFATGTHKEPKSTCFFDL
jgi:hypothetical protein